VHPDGSVDLADYSTNLKAGQEHRLRLRLCGGMAGARCCVGYALDLGEAIKRFQRTSPVPILVRDAMWVPDHGMATMIAQSVLASITPHRKAGLARFAGGISIGRGQSYELPTLPRGR
jgi:hypothetical protein